MTGLQFCEVAHKCAHEDKRPFGSMVAGESIRHGSNDCHSVLLDFSVGCTAIIESARVSLAVVPASEGFALLVMVAPVRGIHDPSHVCAMLVHSPAR